MFDDSLKANLVWLEEQKKLGIFAPKFVFDHVIRQLEEMIEYEILKPFCRYSKKISDIGISEEKRNEFLIELSKTIDSDVKPSFEHFGICKTTTKANEYQVFGPSDGNDFYALRLKSYNN